MVVVATDGTVWKVEKDDRTLQATTTAARFVVVVVVVEVKAAVVVEVNQAGWNRIVCVCSEKCVWCM